MSSVSLIIISSPGHRPIPMCTISPSPVASICYQHPFPNRHSRSSVVCFADRHFSNTKLIRCLCNRCHNGRSHTDRTSERKTITGHELADSVDDVMTKWGAIAELFWLIEKKNSRTHTMLKLWKVVSPTVHLSVFVPSIIVLCQIRILCVSVSL